MTQDEHHDNHSRYIHFRTVERVSIIKLVDLLHTSPYLKVICVYISLVDRGWVYKEGHSAK